jgi:hypothetical protein
MEDIVFNATMNFQLFCNGIIRQKNLDKLVPKGMGRSEWNTKKADILSDEIESVNRYLNEQAVMRLGSYSPEVKQDIEHRFSNTINQIINDYKEKLFNYHQ